MEKGIKTMQSLVNQNLADVQTGGNNSPLTKKQPIITSSQRLSSRAPEMAMIAAAMTGVSLGTWILAISDRLNVTLTLVAIVLTLTAFVFALVAAAGFRNADHLFRQLHNQNEKMADRLWEASESEDRASDLFDQLGDLVILCDAKRNILYANSNFLGIFGRPLSEVKGQNFSSLGINAPRYGLRTRMIPEDVMIAGRWYSWVELRSPLGKVEGPAIRVVARDIHSHKESENLLIEARKKAEAANQSKSKFLATVSHEIRTPLNGITGMARLLADTSLSEEQTTYVAAVTSSGQSLLSLIEDLLDFSKIESGRLDLRPEQLDIREFCENLVELVAARAHAKLVSISSFIAQDVPVHIVTDVDRLRQSLLNLLGNALKFTQDGGISLEVNVSPGSVQFAVRDSGQGINRDDQLRIFEEFEQVESGNTRNHGGVGLGLSITRKLVMAMGGTLSVESHIGKGSLFSICLPSFGTASPMIVSQLGKQNCVIALHSSSEAQNLMATITEHGGNADLCAREIADDAATDYRKSTLLIDLVTAQSLRIASVDFTMFGRRIILIEPGERGQLDDLFSQGFDSYLVRPVRAKSLVRVLLGVDKIGDPAKKVRPKLRTVHKNHRKLLVLVAEDNEINAMMVKASLMRSGHDVTVVGDGRAAVRAAMVHNNRPDIILMDLHMPLMDGLDAITAIRKSEDELGLLHVPIYALTADGQAGVESTVRSVGGNGYVTKPVDPFRLVTIVEEAVAA